MAMKSGTEIKLTLTKILKEVRNELPSDSIEITEDFIFHEEWGLAFDTICSQIFEDDIRISKSLFEKISFLGNLMNIDKKVWQPLEKLVD